MRVVGPPSKDFDPRAVIAPERFGGVAWGAFNAAYGRLQATPWHRVNAGRAYGVGKRLSRLAVAWVIAQNDAFLDLRTKATALARLPVPRDPDIVYYGAEVGWEAYLLRALFGDGGRLVLVDADPEAHARYEAAETERRIPWRGGTLTIRRDAARTEYVVRDFFDWREASAFDVGLDWGLLEHFDAEGKARVVRRFAEGLRPGGVQISAVPRDGWVMRVFYTAFADELNFGYRELLDLPELVAIVTRGGLTPIATTETGSTCIVAARRG
jgi:SAM-dependent methyltransferase